MSDTDCCADLGLGAGCPSRTPNRALCQIDPANGWDHVCRTLAGACQDDAECRAKDPGLVCAENAPYWCAVTLCPGLNTCLATGCMRDDECKPGSICIVQGRIGHCEVGCSAPSDCLNMGGFCMANLYPEDPRSVCVRLQNEVVPPLSPAPKANECNSDRDCVESKNGPRCNASLGRCGCAGAGDCTSNERCRMPLGETRR
jgi:hypothetical protein